MELGRLESAAATLRQEKDTLVRRAEESESKYRTESQKVAASHKEKESASAGKISQLEQALRKVEASAKTEGDKLTAELVDAEKRFKKEQEALELSLKNSLSKAQTEMTKTALKEAEAKSRAALAALETKLIDRESAHASEVGALNSEIRSQQEAFSAERQQLEKQLKLASEKHQRGREELVSRLAAFEERLEKDRGAQETSSKQLEEKLHLVTEGTRDLIITIEGEDGLITDLNARFDDVTGWNREDWKQQPFANLVHEQDLAKAFEAYSQALAKQTVAREIRLKRSAEKGESGAAPVALFSFTFRPSLRSGRVVGAFAFGHDLSEQQHLEEELSASESRYRLLVENAGAPIILMDRRGHFLDANQRACELLGYTHKQLQRMKLPNLNPTEFERASTTFLRDLQANGEVRGEYLIHRREGEPIKAVLSALDMRDDTYLMFLHDLTDQARLQESMRFVESSAVAERDRLTAALAESERQRQEERTRLVASAKQAEAKHQAERERLDSQLKMSEERHLKDRAALENSLKSAEQDYQTKLKTLESSLHKSESQKDVELRRLEAALKALEKEREVEKERLEIQLKDAAAQHERDRQDLMESIGKSQEEKLTKRLQAALKDAESKYTDERNALEKALAETQARMNDEKARLEEAARAAAALQAVEKDRLGAELRLAQEKHQLEAERLRAALKMSEKRLEEERRALTAQQEDTESHYQFEIKRLETAHKDSDRRHDTIVKRLQTELEESQRAREEERARLESALAAAEDRRTKERERLEATLRSTESRLHDELARLESALSAAQSRSEELLSGTQEQSEQIMQEVIETVHEVVIGVDARAASGGRDLAGGKIVMFNPVAEQVSGYRRDQALERDASFLFTGSDKTTFLQSVRAVAKSGEPVSNVRCNVLTAHGDTRSVVWRMGRLRRLDGSQYVLAVGKDVTADEALQVLLAETQRLGLVGALTGGIAHNFNDLMNAILGYSSLLLERLKEGEPNYESVVQLRQAAKRAAGLSEHLSVFSRRTSPELQSVSLNIVVEEVTRLSQETFVATIQIAAHTEKDLWDVQVDPVQMQQVLMNLMVNARDNLPKGGKIVIETLNKEITDKESGQPVPFVVARVTDTGKALTKEARARIFSPNYRPVEGGARDVRSLGMSVAYGIVKSCDGWIEVDSDAASGNMFSIYLPAHGAGMPSAPRLVIIREESEEPPAPPEPPAEKGPPQRMPPAARGQPTRDSGDRSLMPEVKSQSPAIDRKARGRTAFDSDERYASSPPSGSEAKGRPPSPGEGPIEGTETVFVVDSSRGDLDLAHVFLKKFGYKVLVASESQQALQAFKFLKDEVRIAVIDLGMPEMDGLQLYGELRRIAPQLRVLFTAKNSTDASLRQEAAYQGYSMLRKPLTDEALARGVRKALDAP
ncbi:MAG: PAS domain S-box protein [bacterium]